MGQNKLVIFDLDGTLFRTETVDIEAINKALVTNGFLQRPSEEILNLIGYSMDDACELLFDRIDKWQKD